MPEYFPDAVHPGISLAEVGALLPSRPLITAAEQAWDRAILQRFSLPPGHIDLPSASWHILVLNLSGHTLIEESTNKGRLLRRWSDPGSLSFDPAGKPVKRRLIGPLDVLLVHLEPSLVRDVEADVFGSVLRLGELPSQVAVDNKQLTQLGRLPLSEATSQDEPGSALVADLLVRSLIVHSYDNTSITRAPPRTSLGPAVIPG